MWPACRW